MKCFPVETILQERLVGPCKNRSLIFSWIVQDLARILQETLQDMKCLCLQETRTPGKHISPACMQPMHPCRNSPLLAIQTGKTNIVLVRPAYSNIALIVLIMFGLKALYVKSQY